MKSLIIICVAFCIAGAYSHDLSPHKDAAADVDACVAESGVNRQVLTDMKDGKDFEVTRELNCFSACMFKKNGVMKEDGSVNHDPADSAAATECKNLSGDDVCETAGKIVGCMIKHDLIPKLN